MFYDNLKFIFKKKFLCSIFLHLLHGFIFEKSKLYYPYTFNKNILLIKTDLYKFYLSTCFILLAMPYLLSKFSPIKYSSVRSAIESRYQNRDQIHIQIGSYLLGLSMILTGFCPSFLPMYLALSPVLFLYSVATSYTAYIIYHVFGPLFFNRIHLRPIHYRTTNICKLSLFFFCFNLNSLLVLLASISSEKETLNNVGRIIILSICILLLLIFETSEQSISPGHSSDELLDLLYHGDYLPPGLSGLLCGCINFLLIFLCGEYQTLTSEWLINIFYYTSDFTTDQTKVTGQLCLEQILKVISMSFGVRLSLWTSKRHDVPNIDWLFYILVGSGSFIGAFSVSLTTGTFTDHIYLVNALMGNIPAAIISWTIGAAWILLYFAKLLGL